MHISAVGNFGSGEFAVAVQFAVAVEFCARIDCLFTLRIPAVRKNSIQLVPEAIKVM